MKLVRWTLAGASFYVIYKYTIGKKAKGEDVFAAPEADAEQVAGQTAATPKPKRPRRPKKT
jgi:hypothetical protein